VDCHLALAGTAAVICSSFRRKRLDTSMKVDLDIVGLSMVVAATR
jgi:hypothetical protein